MRRQAGMALVTVLLVVAIASLAATALLASANVAIHRSAALRDSEQAWWIARGVESWVLGILQEDLKENPNRDGLGEPWALPVDYLPVDQGHVRGQVVDLEGRFNLNNLVVPRGAPPGQGAAQAAQNVEKHRRHFQRMLQNLTDQEIPPGLLANIVDWIDEDQEPTPPNGAEDLVYLSLRPAYRAANRPFTVVSELLAVHGMTPKLYAALRELVCALPPGTEINVNTAPAAVLQAMSETTDALKLQQFLQRRVDEPAEKKQDVQDIWGADVVPYGFQTSYFQIQGEVFVGSSRVALYSLIHRPKDGPAPTVLAHAAEAE